MSHSQPEPSQTAPGQAQPSRPDPSQADPSQADPGQADQNPGQQCGSRSPQRAIRPMESTRMGLSDAAALADLQMHWGSVYVIGLDGDIWSATFRGTRDELRAHTCLELRTLIRADYSYRQQAGRPATPGDRMSM